MGSPPEGNAVARDIFSEDEGDLVGGVTPPPPDPVFSPMYDELKSLKTAAKQLKFSIEGTRGAQENYATGSGECGAPASTTNQQYRNKSGGETGGGEGVCLVSGEAPTGRDGENSAGTVENSRSH